MCLLHTRVDETQGWYGQNDGKYNGPSAGQLRGHPPQFRVALSFLLPLADMGRTKSASTTAAIATTRKKKNPQLAPTVASLQQLKNLSDEGRKKHLLSERTVNRYDGIMRQGTGFLGAFVTERRRSVEDKDGMLENEIDGEPIDIDLLADAFNETKPNRYSAFVAEMFLTDRCLDQKKGVSTADGINAALLWYWDRM